MEGHRFILRHLRQADAEKYQVFFNELDEESVRCRFGYLISKLTEAAARQRTVGNAENEKSLAVFDDHQDQIIAVGRCCLDDKTADAEIALVVSEPMRGLGIGRFLLDQLVEIAIEEKSKSVSAFLATKNAPVIKLLHSAGFTLDSAHDGDDLKLVLKISTQDLSPRTQRANVARSALLHQPE